jgi:putative transposase
MPNYRRNYTKGGTYFFTVVTGTRAKILYGDMVDVLRGCFKECMQRYPYHMDAIVVLPDHLHCLWRLPEGDDNFSVRWKHIKAGFTKNYLRRVNGIVTGVSEHMKKKGASGIWQQRFWEHTIRDDNDFKLHCDYIHYNPVKHGYVDSPGDWPFSSFPRYVAQGLYDVDWGIQPLIFPEMAIGK